MTESNGTETAQYDDAIEIVQYSDGLASSMAEMFNGWDDLWPGGFTEGVPYDEERVKKRFGKMSAIVILLAHDKETNKLVGMCTLHSDLHDSEAAYIGILGASPEVLGKKVGKRLLLRAIEITVKNSYSRVFLNTWAGNMRAVPLYKKVGMMWNPRGEGLRMEDYMPEILTHPLSKPFFKEPLHPDEWYDLHKREIIQAPDDFKEDGMEIYPYLFERNDDVLSVTVDRHSRGVTAIERTLSGQKIRVSAKVRQHLALCGVPSIYAIEFENSTDKEMRIGISLDGFESLHFNGEPSTDLTLKAGESTSWAVPFHLDSSAPIHRATMKTPSIVARINMNKVKFSLRTGLVIKPLAEIRTRWGTCRVAPAGKTDLPITLYNESSESVSGTLYIEKPNGTIKVNPAEREIELPANGLGGAVIEVEAEADLQPGTYDLWAYLKVDTSGTTGETIEVTTRKFRIPVYCLHNGDVLVGENDRRRRVAIVSSNYSASFAKEGALLRVNWAKGLGGMALRLSSQIGPPFGINPFRFAERKPEIQTTDTSTIVSMIAKHPDRPIDVEDRVTFEKNSRVIKHEVWLSNTSNEPHRFQVRVNGSGGGISLSAGKAYVPLKSGVVEGRTGNALFTSPAIPTAPDAFSEGWVAAENQEGTKGYFWDLNEVEEVHVGSGHMSSLHYPSMTIKGGETKRVSLVYAVIDVTDWRSVRSLYRSLFARKFETPLITDESRKTNNVYGVEAKPVIIPSRQSVETALRIRKGIMAPIPGTLSVTAPEGWTASITKMFEDGAGVVSDIIENAQFQDNEEVNVKLEPKGKGQDGFVVLEGSYGFSYGISSDEPFTLLQLGNSNSSVEVSKSKEQGSRVFRVKNGQIEFAVSPDYGGCMTSLRNAIGTELLVCPFPTPTMKPGGFLDNYYGGVQPVIWDDEMDVDLTQANTNKEKFDARHYEHGIWQGVEVTWKGSVQQITRGMDFALQYLTAPGSPLVLIRWQISNTTSAPVRFIPTLFLDTAFDGDISDVVLTADWEGRRTGVQPSPFPISMMLSSNALWMRRGKSQTDTEGLGLLMSGSIPGTMGLSISSYLLLGVMDFNTMLMPGEEKIFTTCLFVDPSGMDDLGSVQSLLEQIF